MFCPYYRSMYITREKVIAYQSFPSLVLRKPVKYTQPRIYSSYCVARNGPCNGQYVYPLYLNCPIYKRMQHLKSSERLLPYPDVGPIPPSVREFYEKKK